MIMSTKPQPDRVTVLVVDDEPDVRALTARILEQVGFRPLQANGGSDALALVDQYGPPHLVLTDLKMPGIGGSELASRLWARWPALPILFMSAYSADEFSNLGASGASGGLIQKPFPPDQLVASVVAALTRASTGSGMESRT